MSTLFTLDKDEWDTKEEEYSGMLKANLSGWYDIEQWKIKPKILAYACSGN